MVSIEEMERMLASLLDELPEPLFEGLNGGVSLLAEARVNPELPEVCILGEYVRDLLGNRINLYYGSFLRVFGDRSPVELRRELRKTLRHEFRHHVEARAGADDLEREDAAQMEEFRRKSQARGNTEQPAREQGRRGGGRFLRRKR